MSTFSFIASDYELPEVENTKVKIITVKEAIRLKMPANKLMPWEKMDPEDKILITEDENDLDELEIKQLPEYDENVTWYTNKPFIYMVDFRYTEERGQQLLEYLISNIKEGYELELWQVWLDQREDVVPQQYNSSNLTLEALQQMYDTRSKSYSSHSCIKISQ